MYTNPPSNGRHGRDRYPEFDAGDRPEAKGWYWLLWLPIALALLVPVYNRLTPALFGIPFFYWWQMGLAALSSTTLSVVHLATKARV